MNFATRAIAGHVFLKTDLDLYEVGKLISMKIFGGLAFAGEELSIHEEVPAIFIQSPILGLTIILDEYSGKYIHGFNLFLEPSRIVAHSEGDNRSLDQYLYFLLKSEFEDIPEIEVLDNVIDE